MILALLGNLLRLLVYPLLLLRRARAAPRGAYVTLELDGPVVDLPRPSARLLALLRGAARPATSIARLSELGRAVAGDPRVAGLLVQVKSLAAGRAVIGSLRRVLAEVRAAGKDVVVYLPQGADNATLFVASAARLVAVGPETLVAPIGFAARGRYVRTALARVGVEPEVFARGAYKSAGESLVRDAMSDAQREQLGALLDTLHRSLVEALAEGRRVPAETAARWIDQAPHAALRSAELGIVDAVVYEDELERLVAGDRGRVPLVPAGHYLRARKAPRFRPLRRRPVIGVVEVHGPIVSRAPVSLGRVAAEDGLVAAVRAARANPAVRGVVLHIDSPGGSALASDRIHHEVARLAEVKPVVAYLSNVAASGGYYIASAAHAIVAQRESVTGSIGVVTARVAVGPLLERIGIFTDVVKRGARADLFSPERRLDEGERAVLERELDAFYRTFLRVVAAGRNKPVEAIEPLAGGRVYSGEGAHAAGLVDRLGGLDTALDELRSRLGEGARTLEPALVRPPRATPPPPPLPPPAPAALSALGLGPLLEAAQLALDREDHRVLAWWPGSIEP